MKRELASVVIFESHAKAGTVCESSFVLFVLEYIGVHTVQQSFFLQSLNYYYFSDFDLGYNHIPSLDCSCLWGFGDVNRKDNVAMEPVAVVTSVLQLEPCFYPYLFTFWH